MSRQGEVRQENRRVRAVILDMDGLMLDTEPSSLQAWKEAAAELGYVLTDDLLHKMIGLNAEATAHLLKRRFGDDFPAARLASRAVVKGGVKPDQKAEEH